MMKKLMILLVGLWILPISASTVVVVPKVCPSDCKPGHCVKHPKRRAKCAALCSATVSATCNTPRVVVVGPPVIVERPWVLPRPHPHHWGRGRPHGKHHHR